MFRAFGATFSLWLKCCPSDAPLLFVRFQLGVETGRGFPPPRS